MQAATLNRTNIELKALGTDMHHFSDSTCGGILYRSYDHYF